MSKQPGCKAHYERGGTMRCDRCGIIWDHDDPEPPECLTDRERGRRAIERMKQELQQQGEKGNGYR